MCGARSWCQETGREVVDKRAAYSPVPGPRTVATSPGTKMSNRNDGGKCLVEVAGVLLSDVPRVDAPQVRTSRRGRTLGPMYIRVR